LDANVLLAEDDPTIGPALKKVLVSRGHRVDLVRTGAEATSALLSRHYHLFVLTLRLVDTDAWSLLDRAVALTHPPMVLVLGGPDSVGSAVRAIRRGAVDYVQEPVDLQDVVDRIDRVMETATMRRKMDVLESRAHATSALVAHSAAMTQVLELAAKVAKTPHTSALLVGESGAGKEVIASYIHEQSERRTRPFVRVNLAAMPATMVEAELFGTARGAFTDAKQSRLGHFATADHGTILLDELTEFRPELQSKLLRVLENRCFHPVGSDRSRSVNVRVLAATNADCRRAVREGLLRADLYFRISTVTIDVPPLRERVDDILPLARHYLEVFSREFGRVQCSLSNAAEQALLSYGYPGNVRELKNMMERAVMLCEGSRIDVDLLALAPRSPSLPASAMFGQPPPLHRPTSSGTHRRASSGRIQTIEGAERAEIMRALAAAGGSKTTAARNLGIARSTLWEKMRRYRLDD
jgi:DNA-binding NtrC family response regulator